MTDDTQARPSPDTNAAPPPGAGPGIYSAGGQLPPYEDQTMKIIDKLGDLWEGMSNEPTSRVERLVVALLGVHPPAPADVKPEYPAQLVSLANAIHGELLKLEVAADAPSVGAAPAPETAAN